MTTDRGKKAVIATIATVLWLGYMVIGLWLLNTYAPTTGGEGPDGDIGNYGGGPELKRYLLEHEHAI